MCLQGFRLRGDKYMTCQYGRWKGSRPYCDESKWYYFLFLQTDFFFIDHSLSFSKGWKTAIFLAHLFSLHKCLMSIQIHMLMIKQRVGLKTLNYSNKFHVKNISQFFFKDLLSINNDNLPLSNHTDI